jgi:hypothetical protein
MGPIVMAKVTRGLPVYKWAKLGRRAIDSILQQMVGDLELLIMRR